jgi:hypothetical protein
VPKSPVRDVIGVRKSAIGSFPAAAIAHLYNIRAVLQRKIMTVQPTRSRRFSKDVFEKTLRVLIDKSHRFVHSLEERVRELEEQQANLASNETHQQPVTQRVPEGLPSVTNAISGHEDTLIGALGQDAGLPFADQHMSDRIPNVDANIVPSPSTSAYRAADDTLRPRPRVEETLEQNLRDVSLAAVAEPYLGTISGLTFAKLTQAVLRRLSPDGRDFVFRTNINENAMPIEGATNLHLDLINSMYFDYDQAIDFSLLAEESTMPLFDTSAQRETIQLPTRNEVVRLATFYFDHSHTLYPIIHQQEVMSDINSVLQNPDHQLTMSPPCLFRIWMVLAIGSTTYSSIALTEELVSQLYYEKAMTYFDASMDHGDVVSVQYIEDQAAVLTHARLHWKPSCFKYHFPSSTNRVRVSGMFC